MRHRPDLVVGGERQVAGPIVTVAPDLVIGTPLGGAVADPSAPAVVESDTGDLGVLTGRLHVICSDQAPLHATEAAVAEFGLVIDHITPWAPHSGYLRRADQHAVAILDDLDRLADTKIFDQVQPEIIQPATRRDTDDQPEIIRPATRRDLRDEVDGMAGRRGGRSGPS